MIKYVVETTYKPILDKYLSCTRNYNYKGIRLQIPPQVFHPGFFFSTQLLLKFINRLPLQQMRVLELGAGSGLIAIEAARKGACVTASDINPIAIDYLEKNKKANGVEFTIIYSDLFASIPEQHFDMIIINPPYYKKQPITSYDYAWYCGENGEYFEKLFSSIGNYVLPESTVIMTLCDGCDIEMVRAFASKNNFQMKCVYSRKNLIERNFIYQIKPVGYW
ncbi:methyltransferase [Chitinophagaceae bacterium LB-8]|uniref:Methyltransferase n=1 Tax=Paraflavisolibacter caeni TaxID=2982496 RepID=A0A9X3B7A0_9BACT|nr:methyltransferase [Paraflavisolibacter caeni]MCU7548975.1 methyltransferase [Paraflavisolibacter caeni]